MSRYKCHECGKGFETEIEREAHIPCTVMESERDICHALILPFPVSTMMVWCGKSLNDPSIKRQSIASVPESVNCIYCIDAMRRAKIHLEDWVPKLAVKND